MLGFLCASLNWSAFSKSRILSVVSAQRRILPSGKSRFGHQLEFASDSVSSCVPVSQDLELALGMCVNASSTSNPWEGHRRVRAGGSVRTLARGPTAHPLSCAGPCCSCRFDCGVGDGQRARQGLASQAGWCHLRRHELCTERDACHVFSWLGMPCR